MANASYVREQRPSVLAAQVKRFGSAPADLCTHPHFNTLWSDTSYMSEPEPYISFKCNKQCTHYWRLKPFPPHRTEEWTVYLVVWYVHSSSFTIYFAESAKIVNRHIAQPSVLVQSTDVCFFSRLPLDIPHLFFLVYFFHDFTGWCKGHTWQITGGFWGKMLNSIT